MYSFEKVKCTVFSFLKCTVWEELNEQFHGPKCTV